MFKKLFQRKPKPSNKERQLERIESLDSSSPQHLSQLLELAKSDPDPNIRSAAASRIGLRDCLAALLKDEQDATVRSRLVKLLFKQCSDDDAIEIATNLLRHADDDKSRIALLADVQQPAAATFIATRIQDPKALIEAAVEHKISRVRLAAAQQLQDEDSLHELAHKARDKSVNQWVRARLKEVKELRHQEEQNVAQIEKIIDDGRQLAKSDNPVDYRQRLSRLQSHFESLQQQSDAAQQQVIQQIFSDCGTRADDFEQASADAANAKAEPTMAAEKTAEPIVEEAPPIDPEAHVRDQIHANLADALDAETTLTVESIRTLLHNSRSAWDTLSNDSPQHGFHLCFEKLKDAATSQEYLAANGDALLAMSDTTIDDSLDDETLQTLHNNLKEYLDVLSWPANWPVPEAIQKLRESHHKTQQLHKQRRELSRKRAQQLDKKIHRMGEALRRKNLRLANNIHREVEEALPKFTGHEQRKLQQHLDKHLPEFTKLLDWHEYSSEPKKEALCEQMEALIERQQPPEARAESVKKLRAEWRTVTAANVKKDDPLWTRFNAAAEQAYAPCEPFFEKLNERKRDNLNQRERLTDELEQLMADINWQQPSFDMLDKVLRTARAEWQQYSPVHFPDAKPCQKRFDALMDKVHGALQTQRKNNAKLREQLISRANALVEHTDVDESISQALKLQDEWKAIGPVTPQMQRKQWQQFRQSMDAVFARRQAARDASNAEQQSQINEVKTLIEKLEELAKRPEEQLSQTSEEASALQQQISEASQDLGKKALGGLLRRQHHALDTIAEKQSSLPLRKRARSYAALAELSQRCSQAEAAILSGESAPANIDLSDSQWQNLMQSRIDKIANADVDQLRASQAENLRTLERLAIELEILADVDTPSDYRGQRRAWQLDMLESGETVHDGREPEDRFFELLQRWHAVAAVDNTAYQPMAQRFKNACQPFAKLLDVGSEPSTPAAVDTAPPVSHHEAPAHNEQPDAEPGI